MMNIDEFIKEIERSLNINLLDYEVKLLKTLIEAKQKGQKVIIHPARARKNSYVRTLLIFDAISSMQDELENGLLYGDKNAPIPKGLFS